MAFCCHYRSKARLSSLVLCITLGSATTWFFFAVQLQAKESKPAPRQALDSPSPPPEEVFITTPMFGGRETAMHFAPTYYKDLDMSEC